VSGLVIIVWAEAAKDEDRICKEQEGSEPSAWVLSSILIIVFFCSLRHLSNLSYVGVAILII